jgi:hypothetical protein
MEIEIMDSSFDVEKKTDRSMEIERMDSFRDVEKKKTDRYNYKFTDLKTALETTLFYNTNKNCLQFKTIGVIEILENKIYMKQASDYLEQDYLRDITSAFFEAHAIQINNEIKQIKETEEKAIKIELNKTEKTSNPTFSTIQKALGEVLNKKIFLVTEQSRFIQEHILTIVSIEKFQEQETSIQRNILTMSWKEKQDLFDSEFKFEFFMLEDFFLFERLVNIENQIQKLKETKNDPNRLKILLREKKQMIEIRALFSDNILKTLNGLSELEEKMIYIKKALNPFFEKQVMLYIQTMCDENIINIQSKIMAVEQLIHPSYEGYIDEEGRMDWTFSKKNMLAKYEKGFSKKYKKKQKDRLIEKNSLIFYLNECYLKGKFLENLDKFDPKIQIIIKETMKLIEQRDKEIEEQEDKRNKKRENGDMVCELRDQIVPRINHHKQQKNSGEKAINPTPDVTKEVESMATETQSQGSATREGSKESQSTVNDTNKRTRSTSGLRGLTKRQLMKTLNSSRENSLSQQNRSSSVEPVYKVEFTGGHGKEYKKQANGSWKFTRALNNKPDVTNSHSFNKSCNQAIQAQEIGKEKRKKLTLKEEKEQLKQPMQIINQKIKKPSKQEDSKKEESKKEETKQQIQQQTQQQNSITMMQTKPTKKK